MSQEKLRKILYVVLILGIAIRLVLYGYFVLHNPDGFSVNDSHEYIQIADNMLEGNGFTRDLIPPYNPESFRTPGYPAFLLIFKFLIGSYLPALVVQIGLSILTAWFLYKIAQLLNREKEGVIAATVFLFMPFSILVTVQFLTQTLFTCCVAGALYAFIAYLKNTEKTQLLIIAACILPLAAYIRPIAGYISAIFLLILVVMLFRKEISVKRAVFASSILLIAFFAILGPWLVRNERVFGRAELSSINAPFLYFYDAPATYAIEKHISVADARAFLEKDIAERTGVPTGSMQYTNFSPITDTVTKRAVEVILESPRAFIESRISFTFNFFFRDGVRYVFEAFGAPYTYLQSTPFLIAAIIERLVLLVFLAGFAYLTLVSLIRFKTQSLSIGILVLTVLYFAALTGSMASAGLRYPAEPFFLLLGTIGLIELYTMILGRIRPKKL